MNEDVIWLKHDANHAYHDDYDDAGEPAHNPQEPLTRLEWCQCVRVHGSPSLHASIRR